MEGCERDRWTKCRLRRTKLLWRGVGCTPPVGSFLAFVRQLNVCVERDRYITEGNAIGLEASRSIFKVKFLVPATSSIAAASKVGLNQLRPMPRGVTFRDI